MPRLACATTLGELKASGYRSRSVKEELRQNLIRKLEADEPKFEGIVGFEETVVPQVENALLSGQDIIFLGERGQAKTRLARTLPTLLDEWLPIVERLRDQRRSAQADLLEVPHAARRAVATTRPSTGCRATAATAKSSPRPTSPSPT